MSLNAADLQQAQVEIRVNMCRHSDAHSQGWVLSFLWRMETSISRENTLVKKKKELLNNEMSIFICIWAFDVTLKT